MKVVFDNIIYSLQRAGGISGVWTELISRFMSHPGIDAMFVEHSGAERNIFRSRLSIPHGRIIPAHSLPPALGRWLVPNLPDFGEPFVFHSSYYRTASPASGALNVTTVHDFIYDTQRVGSPVARALHRRMMRRAIARSAAVVCVSRATARDLLALYGHAVSPVVIPNAPLCRPSGEVPAERGRKLLYVGSRAPYKRFELAVEASAILGRTLVAAGAPLASAERRMIARAGAQVEPVVYPSGDTLAGLYSSAAALIYPSAAEGFGIPVTEAQAWGCPVVAVDAPWLRCVAAPGSVMAVCAPVARAIASAVESLDDRAVRESLVEAGHKNAARYSWQRAADDYFNIYSSLIGR